MVGLSAGANYAACWPVPLPISRIQPLSANTARSTSSMGCRLFSQAWLNGRITLARHNAGTASRVNTHSRAEDMAAL